MKMTSGHGATCWIVIRPISLFAIFKSLKHISIASSPLPPPPPIWNEFQHLSSLYTDAFWDRMQFSILPIQYFIPKTNTQIKGVLVVLDSIKFNEMGSKNHSTKNPKSKSSLCPGNNSSMQSPCYLFSWVVVGKL